LYALDAENGDLAWVYPTELPLGHSPTVVDSVVYVGGYDRKLHALEAAPDPVTLPEDSATGYHLNDQVLWTFEAEAGFETNPLVVNGVVYAGNRDGYFYALDAATGSLKWRHQTDGPIRFSAAYKDDVVFFASNDSHAYALRAGTGELVWKSAKLPGAGFHSYWPVVYGDWVIFAGSHNYSRDKTISEPLHPVERDELYQGIPDGELIGPEGTEPGDWVPGTVTIDASRIAEYLENKPWRRTYFVLNRLTGEEFTFDSDNDGKPEYAPIAWTGTRTGNRYPPVIGSDGVIYQQNNYIANEYICRGGISGWKFGTPFISRVHEGNYGAVDEPMAYSAGGNLIYWGIQVNFSGGSYDITIPHGSDNRSWIWWMNNLDELIPGYDIMYSEASRHNFSTYGNENGGYGSHGPQNPSIPYDGKVYMHRGNSIIAWGNTTEAPDQLPLAQVVEVEAAPTPLSAIQLKQKLAAEVEKILAAGHLRPGYHASALSDFHLGAVKSSHLTHYFHNPAETFRILIRAMPHLSPQLQQQIKTYLQDEFINYGNFVHAGWENGSVREIFDTPPEAQTKMASFAPKTAIYGSVWDEQYRFYGLWKYAQEFEGAKAIFDGNDHRLATPPSDSELDDYPYIHNAFIAGYIGYLELEKLAGYSESTDVRAELDRLMTLRASNFSKDFPQDVLGERSYEHTLNVSRNFMYLVPELADYLRDSALAEVEKTVEEANEIVPCWFVSKYDSTYNEGVLHVLFAYHSIFQAKALILREPFEELVKYVDVPGLYVGDLFYIDNLVSALKATHFLDKAATPSFGDQGAAITYTPSFLGTGNTLTLTDTLPLGVSAPGNFEVEGTSVTPSYDAERHRLTWSDTPPAGQIVTIRYIVTITTSDHQALINTAELSEAGGEPSTATATVIANPYLAYLPVILKND
jgi:hypothetical protein